MKKESLSIITVKTLLAVVIFAGIGTIIIGGVCLIGKWKSNAPISSIPTERCAKAGEGCSNPSLGPSTLTPRECCEGLVEIYTGLRYEPSDEYANENGCIHLEGSAYTCSDCGNGICESWENRCNCPGDCGDKVDTADWETYRNKEFGFKFEYPSMLALEEEKDEQVSWKTILVFIKSNDFNSYIFVNSAGVGTGFGTEISEEDIKIDNISTKLKILDSSIDNEKAMVVSFSKDKDEYFWVFRFDEKDDNKLSLAKKILSTFKFIE